MKIGIVGATGLVGRKIIEIIDGTAMEVSELKLFASNLSAGKSIKFRDTEYKVEQLSFQAMRENYDYLLFSAGKEVSLNYASAAENAGNIVIDNSSAYRKSRPLIVPEINGHLLKGYRGIIANPNCSTIQLVLALHPLNRLYGLKRLIVSTYQSVSGAGNQGISALMSQREQAANQSSGYSEKTTIDLNLFPLIGEAGNDGYCEEETKMRYETGRILSLPELKMAVTTVRVPVLYGHCESVYAEFEKDIDYESLEEVWQNEEYIEYLPEHFITPKEVEGSDKSYICRLRKGLDAKSILFWNAADNVRVGAATNAVRILKQLMLFESNS